MIRIFPYNRYSKSARALAAELDCWIIKQHNSRYRPRAGDVVVNWGLGRMWCPATTINIPMCVERVVNKRTFFEFMGLFEVNEDCPPPRIPEWTVSREMAQLWAENGKKVVVRRLLNACEGRGIEIHTEPGNIPQAPLYVKYIPKSAEYRVHIVGGEIIDLQKKVLRRTVDPATAEWGIRNTANGFVFQRNGIDIHEDVKTQALNAFNASGLNFAAADVIWNNTRREAYVLELNTAPGIEGSTVKKYAEAFRRYLE